MSDKLTEKTTIKQSKIYNDCIAKINKLESEYENAETTLQRFAAWKQLRKQKAKFHDLTGE